MYLDHLDNRFAQAKARAEIALQRRVRDAHLETWLYAQEALEYIRRL